MKKKSIIISILIIVIAVTGIYLLTRPKALGNMTHSYTEQTTAVSDISFSGEAGNRINFSFKSTIESGNLDIILYDSEGHAIYKLDKAKELETFFTLDNSDTYTLAAEYNDFIGSFKVKVYKAD